MGIYLYGWRRLSPWVHWWSGVPMVLAGLLSAAAVVSANALDVTSPAASPSRQVASPTSIRGP